MATRVHGNHLRLTLCTYSPHAHKRRRNRHRTWTRHRRSRGCHLPTILGRTRTRRSAVLQSTFVESEGSEGASAFDNRNGINSLHTTGHYDHTWSHLPFSHTSPNQRCHEMDCHLHGAIARAIATAASINRLNHSNQRTHRQWPTRFLKVFGEKSVETQRVMNAAMAELGWV